MDRHKIRLHAIVGIGILIFGNFFSCSKTNFSGAKKSPIAVENDGESKLAKGSGDGVPKVDSDDIADTFPNEIKGSIPVDIENGCGGFSTSSGCFYAIGQHTSVPIDIGLPSVPVSCDNFCSTRGGSNPVGLSCAQCASLFKALYTGPDFQCVDVNPTNYAIDVEHWKTVSPNDPPGFHAAYAASCSVLWMHNGKAGGQSLKYAPNQPHYDLKFGRIYSGGATHWASYICNCKK
jgi:hypothetical protein